MAISAKDAVMQHKVELLRELPLEEAIFFAMAEKAKLFPLGTGDSIRAEKTRVDKVDYFLQHVVEPAADTYLPKLLEVMKNSQVANVVKLAGAIQAAVEPGTYIRNINLLKCMFSVCILFILCMYVHTYVHLYAYSSTHVGLHKKFHKQKNLPVEKSYTNG